MGQERTSSIGEMRGNFNQRYAILFSQAICAGVCDAPATQEELSGLFASGPILAPPFAYS